MLRSDVRFAILAAVGLVGDALAASLTARPPFVLSGVMLPTERGLMIRLSAARPDIVIVDADAEVDATTVDLVRTICDVLRAVPTTSVIVIGDSPDTATATAAVRAGAAAWCDRSTSVDRLVEVMFRVHHGEAWFPPRLLRQMLPALAASTDGAWEDQSGGNEINVSGRPAAAVPSGRRLT
jgi:DNA-binding NarL/FixJ family response regulator